MFAIRIPVAYASTMAPTFLKNEYFFVSQIRKTGNKRQKRAKMIRLVMAVGFR
jgi:hypothetical protein